MCMQATGNSEENVKNPFFLKNMWVQATGNTIKKNGKMYFETKYIKSVLDRKEGDYCFYAETEDVIRRHNFYMPISADRTCFIDDDCTVTGGAKLSNVSVSGSSFISGEIDINDSEICNTIIEIKDPKSKGVERKISFSKIFGTKNTKAKLRVEGKRSSIVILGSVLIQKESEERTCKDQMINIRMGNLYMENSSFSTLKETITVRHSRLKIYNSEILQDAKIVIEEGKMSKIVKSKISGLLQGHSIKMVDSIFNGVSYVCREADGLELINSVVEDRANITIKRKKLSLLKTKMSHFARLIVRRECINNVVFDSCIIRDNATIKTEGNENAEKIAERTTFMDRCDVNNAMLFDCLVKDDANINGIAMFSSEISGNAIVGAEIDGTPIPTAIASQIILSDKNIKSVTDLYIVKVAELYYYAFMGDKVYKITTGKMFEECSLYKEYKALFEQAEKTKGFPYFVFEKGPQKILENSNCKAISFLNENKKNELNTCSFVRNFVYCSLLKLFVSFIRNDYGTPTWKEKQIAQTFESYAKKNFVFDFSKKKAIGLGKDFQITPIMFFAKPMSIAEWFNNGTANTGFVV